MPSRATPDRPPASRRVCSSAPTTATAGTSRRSPMPSLDGWTISDDGDAGRLLRLDGRVALVTGAARRIGRDIARTFANQGASVLIADVDDAAGQRTVAEITTAGGSAAYGHADVGRHDDIRSMVAAAVDRFGRLDILVNNAHW